MNPFEQAICEYGSVPGAVAILGAAAEPEITAALQRLNERAPEAMRQVPEFVIAWAQLDMQYKMASDMGDAKEMRATTVARAKMLKELH